MLMHARYPSPAADAIPLVMIHGFLGGGDFFTPNIAALAAHRPIISLDLPGFAASHAVAAARSIEAMARQVLATLSAMECAPFHLLGHSMGGMVALQMALLAPQKIARLILYATGSDGNLPERFETFAQSKAKLQAAAVAWDEAAGGGLHGDGNRGNQGAKAVNRADESQSGDGNQAAGRSGDGNRGNRRSKAANRANESLAYIARPARQAIVATWFRAGAAHPHFRRCVACSDKVRLATATAALDAMQKFNLTARLPAIAGRTRIIGAAHDRTYAVHRLRAMRAAIAGADLRIMPDCAHNAHLESPAAFGRLVSEFLLADG